MTFLALNGCKSPQSLEYKGVRNIQLKSASLSESTISLDVVFFNPNTYGVQLKQVVCDLYIDNSSMGNFFLDTLLSIPGKSEFTIPAKLKINNKSLLSNGLNLLFNNEVIIEAKGNAKMGKGLFFMNIPFTYKGKQTLNLF